MKKLAILSALAAASLASSSALAQPLKDRLWTFNLAAGYTTPHDVVDEFFDGGVAIDAGSTYMPRRGHFGAWMAFGFSGLDVNDETLDAIGVADGDLRIWHLTGGFIWSTRSKGMFNFYFLAGGGPYRREIDLLNPSVEFVPAYCDPWWDFCQPATLVPTADIVGQDETVRLGYNGGFGFTFTLKNDSQVYTEFRYHSMQSTNEATEFIPFTVGYRW